MDQGRMKNFSRRIFTDIASTMITGLAYVGSKNGLFKLMDGRGPMTVDDVVTASGLHPRYVEEWLKGMVCAEFLDYDPQARTYTLPAEHAYFLNAEGTDHFMTGLYERAQSLLSVAPKVAEFFREGGGIRFSDYSDEFHSISDKMNRGNYELRLPTLWMEEMPDVRAKLTAGGRGLDFGCGVGRPPIALAKAFPKSHFVGVDSHTLSIETAQRLAKDEGVSDRVTFLNQRIDDFDSREKFDFISACDCVHDLEDPLGTLRKIHDLLAPAGTFFVIEPKVADELEENKSPIPTMFYGFSMFYCMTQSLAKGGPGLGTCYGTANMKQLMREAGFSRFDVLNIRSPVNVFYAVRH
ncbi:MAG: methyltransferase domain-containing protein [Candidatus Lambdaproteobacteria bacterium]|nr:methyltransferase domain-containing protein [Candidatus Lambdaproteobacteria bacterium]